MACFVRSVWYSRSNCGWLHKPRDSEIVAMESENLRRTRLFEVCKQELDVVGCCWFVQAVDCKWMFNRRWTVLVAGLKDFKLLFFLSSLCSWQPQIVSFGFWITIFGFLDTVSIFQNMFQVMSTDFNLGTYAAYLAIHSPGVHSIHPLFC